MNRLFVSAIIIISALAIAPGEAWASDNMSAINVMPTRHVIKLEAGESKNGAHAVRNVTDMPQHIYVEPRYWHMSKENEDIPLESWLKIPVREFDLAPSEEIQVPYEVTAPQGAVGELVAMIAFRPEPREAQAVNVVFSVSLYLKIKGSEKTGHTIKDFKIWNYKDRKAIGTSVVIENTGNVHLKPRTFVLIKNLRGELQQKATLAFGEPVYPQKNQAYKGSIYNFQLRPGIYKAVIDISYTTQTGVFKKNVYFIVGRNGKILFTLFRRPK